MYKSPGSDIFRKLNAFLAILYHEIGSLAREVKTTKERDLKMKVFTWGIFQVAIGVHCGVHDKGTRLVDTKRLYKHTCKHK